MKDAARRRRLAVVGVSLAALATCVGACVGVPCIPTGLRYGLWADQCPVGDLRLNANISAYGVVRGVESEVDVYPHARFLQGRAPWTSVELGALYRGVDVELTVLDREGQVVDGVEFGRARREGDARRLSMTLPELPDGDYTLRARVTAPFESIEVDAPLALYVPAAVHVLTDRPIYKPGQEVLLRSLMLARTDLEPLDGRPGRWTITAPSGIEMLVEKDLAGSWGVADTSFPLAADAEIGTWKARFASGGDEDEVSFDVRPFQLPRLTVSVSGSQRWYAIGERIAVEGTAAYASGAPVANQPLTVRLGSPAGSWPPPLAWAEPASGRTDANGRFRIELDEVPADLTERVELPVTVSVTEEAGEQVTGRTSLVLSPRGLKVDAVTELGDGLVGGVNNRVYLRVATPDDRPLALADVAVGNPWDRSATPRTARTDEDGVAALQLDPGDPVTVVHPAPPVRVAPPRATPPSLTVARELVADRALDLAERRALDAVHSAVAACSDLVPVGTTLSAQLGLAVDAGGAVRDAVVDTPSPLGACVERASRRARFPAGPERLVKAAWSVPSSVRPGVDVVLETGAGGAPGVEAALEGALLQARSCLAPGRGTDGAVALAGTWRLRDGSRRVEVRTASPPLGHGLSPTERACLDRAVATAAVDAVPEVGGVGAFRGRLQVPAEQTKRASGPTTTKGYELSVAAVADGRSAEGRVVLPTGHVPALRMRATPSLALAGDEVVIEFIRGPDFRGELPEKLRLMEGSIERAEVEVDREAREARFVVPEGVDGFLHADHASARAIVFVRPAAPLAVTLAPDRAAYRPGETARLTVTTTAGGAPVEAGVGLIGVDAQLAQLAPLPGPDAYGRVVVRETSDRPAFGVFEPRALVLGQIRGDDAARAAVLRISALPLDAAGDRGATATAQSLSDDDERLAAGFYRALERLHADVRAWESSAPEGEQMTAGGMVDAWERALDALDAAGTPAVDGYGRRLELITLPDELLAQVDPRRVVSDGTRLPEDVESWERHVREGER